VKKASSNLGDMGINGMSKNKESKPKLENKAGLDWNRCVEYHTSTTVAETRPCFIWLRTMFSSTIKM